MLPTFIICGAARSGTTSLWNYLEAHPDVGMASIKEPCFFTNYAGISGNLKLGNSRFSGQYWRGLEWYESLFRHCNGKKAVGEASTLYMTEHDSPILIHQTIPNAKVIFLLRNPVERFISHYRYWAFKQGAIPSLREMIKEQNPVIQHLIFLSKYHLHLQQYLEIFPIEKIQVFLFEDMVANPKNFVQQVYRTIGVNSTYFPANIETRYNESRQIRALWLQRLVDLSGYNIKRLIRKPSPKWARDLRDRFTKFNSKTINQSFISSEIYKSLAVELTPAVEYIETYLNRELDLWKI